MPLLLKLETANANDNTIPSSHPAPARDKTALGTATTTDDSQEDVAPLFASSSSSNVGEEGEKQGRGVMGVDEEEGNVPQYAPKHA